VSSSSSISSSDFGSSVTTVTESSLVLSLNSGSVEPSPTIASYILFIFSLYLTTASSGKDSVWVLGSTSEEISILSEIPFILLGAIIILASLARVIPVYKSCK
jgi:hypothetical protein